jgi:hypothetical protein
MALFYEFDFKKIQYNKIDSNLIPKMHNSYNPTFKKATAKNTHSYKGYSKFTSAHQKTFISNNQEFEDITNLVYTASNKSITKIATKGHAHNGLRGVNFNEQIPQQMDSDLLFNSVQTNASRNNSKKVVHATYDKNVAFDFLNNNQKKSLFILEYQNGINISKFTKSMFFEQRKKELEKVGFSGINLLKTLEKEKELAFVHAPVEAIIAMAEYSHEEVTYFDQSTFEEENKLFAVPLKIYLNKKLFFYHDTFNPKLSKIRELVADMLLPNNLINIQDKMIDELITKNLEIIQSSKHLFIDNYYQNDSKCIITSNKNKGGCLSFKDDFQLIAKETNNNPYQSFSEDVIFPGQKINFI